jgi:hypothetical protein
VAARGNDQSQGVELGYEVRKIEAEKGCYEVKATDKNGAKIELLVQPDTGEVIKPNALPKQKS